MVQKSLKHKLESILLITLFTCSGLLSLIPFTTNYSIGKDVSTSTETSISDFVNGTLDDLSIIENGSTAELRLKLIDLNKWTNNTPFISPRSREYSTMATIWGTDKVVLFGGHNGNFQFNDTWIFDFSENKWIDMKPIIHPLARRDHAISSIYGTDKVILFGGSFDINKLNDTWIYDQSNNTWEKITTGNNPGKTSQHKMASVFGTDKVVLFGGSKGGTTNETWIFDLSERSWSIQSPVTSPSSRSSHEMTSIFGTDKVIVFAGFFKKNDTWIYDLSDNNWTKMAYGPSMRQNHAMASVYGTDKILLFGGVNRTSWADLNDSWLYDFSKDTWTELKPISNPYAMIAHVMSTIWGTDKVILFTGPDSVSFLGWPNETWIFELDDYLKSGDFVSPPCKFGPNATLKTINWNASILNNTSIKFQLRTSITKSGLTNQEFIGYDGKSNTYYNKTNSTIWSENNGDIWVQYKAYFNTNNNEITPILKNVTILYNHWPNTNLVSPSNHSIVVNTNPIFEWNFSDTDSLNQTTFQILFDDDINFNSIDFDTGEQISSNRSWQFTNETGYSEFPSGNWYWKVRTKDTDDDWSPYSTPWKLIADCKAPNSTINQPINNYCYNELNLISGIATDPINGTGLAKMEITIKKLSDNTYWDGNSWLNSIVWLETKGISNWTFDSSSIDWTSDVKYLIGSRAVDNANNIEPIKPGNVFTFDLEKPTTKIDYPLHDSWLNHLDAITGTAVDLGGAGIKSVEIYIATKADKSAYWNGSAWNPKMETIWLETSNTTVWAYDTTSIPWDSGGQYITRSRVSDFANNSGILSSPVEFGIDPDKPVSTISYPLNNTFLNSLDTVSGSAKEYGGSGIKDVEICITRNIDNKFWYGTNWYLGEYWLATIGTYLWSFDSSNITWTNDLYYTIRSRATDLAGNVQEPYSINTFMYDASPPHTSILINDGAKYTNSTNVILSLEAIDSGSGLDTIELSSDGASWIPEDTFNNTQSYELIGQDGEKTIYLRVADRAGNVAETVFDTIILDTTPPEYLTITINDEDEYTNNRQVLLELNASDSLSGIKDVSYFLDDSWTPWEPFKQLRYISLPLGDGKKNIVYKVRDNAQNIAQASSSIVLDTVPPFSLMISIIDSTSAQDSTSITLKLTAFDNTSGVSQMAFSLDGVNWSTWETFSTTKVYELLAESSSKSIFFKVNDLAGNIAEPVKVKIPTKDEQSPTKSKTSSILDIWNILFIIIIIIIILVMVILILKRKKEPKLEAQQPEETAIVEQTTIEQPSELQEQVKSTPVQTEPQSIATPISEESKSTPPTPVEVTQTPLIGQIPKTVTPEQITQVLEQPQLMPAENITTEVKVDETKKDNTAEDPANDIN